MSDVNRGLDLSRTSGGAATENEKSAFRGYYSKELGRPHPGLEFFLNNVPDAMKQYRAFSGAAAPRPAGGGFVTYYSLIGYAEGVRYLVHLAQHRTGMTRRQVMEWLAVTFLHAGPRGSETIAEALKDFEWIDPPEPARFPEGWAPDPEAFRSGLDFSVKELADQELDSLRRWYLRYLGEVPAYVEFMAGHNPVMLKAYRHRFETCLVELPKQVMPNTVLHYEISRAHGPGIRENVLLARGFGMTLDDVMTTILAPTINAGVETMSLVDEVAGDVLEHWDDWERAERADDR